MPTNWTCETSGSTTDCVVTATSSIDISSWFSTTSPILFQDAGNISFGLAVIATLIFLMAIGFAFNSMKSKKPWR